MGDICMENGGEAIKEASAYLPNKKPHTTHSLPELASLRTTPGELAACFISLFPILGSFRTLLHPYKHTDKRRKPKNSQQDIDDCMSIWVREALRAREDWKGGLVDEEGNCDEALYDADCEYGCRK